MSLQTNWGKGNKFIDHEPAEETCPEGYLKCEKMIDGVWVNTGWAPDVKAVKQHATAIGGAVRAMTDTGYVEFKELDTCSSMCDTTC